MAINPRYIDTIERGFKGIFHSEEGSPKVYKNDLKGDGGYESIYVKVPRIADYQFDQLAELKNKIPNSMSIAPGDDDTFLYVTFF